jgi:cyclohexanone monooxygenase
MTPTGIRTTSTEYPCDIIVFAIGFDAITGAARTIDITGPGGRTLRAAWEDDPKALLGAAVSGFPNLFLVNGPGAPAVLGNVVAFAEQHVDFIAGILTRMRTEGIRTIEALPEAQQKWADHVDQVAHTTLYPKADSWYVGANVPGKIRRFLPYAGGLHTFRDECDRVLENDLADGFALGRHT